MRCQVVLPKISLHLNNFSNALNPIALMYEKLPKQFPRDQNGVAVIKAAGQFLHGGPDWRNSRFDRSQNVRKLYDRFGGQRSSVG